MAKKSTVFNETPPITGGNTYTTQQILDAVNGNIQIDLKQYDIKSISKALKKTNLNLNKTYHIWWLLQFQADYFSNLVDFKFDNYQVNRQVALAIRLGMIYGSSILWRVGNKITAMYVNKIEMDEQGYPKWVQMYRGDMVLMNQQIDFDKQKMNWIEREIADDENYFVFIPNDVNIGGLLKWMPFLNMFETLLRMLNTHSYAYLKSMLYNVKDGSSFEKELELFFDADNPFLINSGDDTIMGNKFKEFQIFKNTNDTDGLIQYIKEFLNIYYDMFGRRYNSDKKRERNITNEVDATQENYDVLQRANIRNINYMLEWVEQKWGYKNLLADKSQEEMEESDDDVKLDNPMEDNLGGNENEI